MNVPEVHELRNILTVILCSIETDNLPLAKQAIRRADALLASLSTQTPRKDFYAAS